VDRVLPPWALSVLVDAAASTDGTAPRKLGLGRRVSGCRLRRGWTRSMFAVVSQGNRKHAERQTGMR